MLKIGLQITSNSKKYRRLLSNIHESIRLREDIRWIHIADDVQLKTELPDLDILVCYRLSSEVFKYAGSRLKWIHFGAAGIEHSLFPALLRSRITITNARGIHSGPVSEFVLGAVLYFAKQFPECRRFMSSREWRQWEIARETVQLRGSQLGVIGYGSIGKAVLARARAFGMHTWAVQRRTPRRSSTRLADHLLPVENLNKMLNACRFVVIACPLTPLTKGMIGSREFQQMPQNAVLINVSRGHIVCEEALIDALKSGQISGAALDVFHQEPLHKSSELFELDNVFLSPHISGNFPEYQTEMMTQFGDILTRWLNRKPLYNTIGKQTLY